MENIMVIIAAVFFMVAIPVGMLSPSDKWKNVVITWSLLVIGIIFFGIGLTL